MSNDLPSVFAVEPPAGDVVRQWYQQHEPAITECLGSSFPGPHDTFKAIDHHIVPFITAHFSPDRLQHLKVCDLGSGGGGVTCYLAKELLQRVEQTHDGYLSSVGVTLTEAAVEESTLLSVKEGVSDHVSFVTGDYHDLSKLFPDDAQFDVVCLINSLCHALSVPRVLHEAFRVLKSDGVLVVKDFYALPITSLYERGLPKETVDAFMTSTVETSSDGDRSPLSQESLYPAFLAKFATNFCMGIFDRAPLEAAISCKGMATERNVNVNFVELDEHTFDGRAFACNCFEDKNPKTGQLSSFGKVVLNGFPPNVTALQLAPFDEGLWFATSVR